MVHKFSAEKATLAAATCNLESSAGWKLYPRERFQTDETIFNVQATVLCEPAALERECHSMHLFRPTVGVGNKHVRMPLPGGVFKHHAVGIQEVITQAELEEEAQGQIFIRKGVV